jgi:hypothetical protein
MTYCFLERMAGHAGLAVKAAPVSLPPTSVTVQEFFIKTSIVGY